MIEAQSRSFNLAINVEMHAVKRLLTILTHDKVIIHAALSTMATTDILSSPGGSKWAGFSWTNTRLLGWTGRV
jgi:hypothetical protein